MKNQLDLLKAACSTADKIIAEDPAQDTTNTREIDRRIAADFDELKIDDANYDQFYDFVTSRVDTFKRLRALPLLAKPEAKAGQ